MGFMAIFLGGAGSGLSDVASTAGGSPDCDASGRDGKPSAPAGGDEALGELALNGDGDKKDGGGADASPSSGAPPRIKSNRLPKLPKSSMGASGAVRACSGTTAAPTLFKNDDCV